MSHRNILTLTAVLVLGGFGCEGEPGTNGTNGVNGVDGTDGADGVNGTDGTDGADGADGQDGEDGQDATVAPADASGLVLTIDDVVSTDVGGSYDIVMTFSITKDGQPYVDTDGVPDESNGLSNLDQSRFYAVAYDAATMTFDDDISFDRQTITATGTAGQYTITATEADYAPELSDAHVYAYVADDSLDVETPDGSHVHLYDYVGSAAIAYGAEETTPYESAANVEGCESCHGSPYMKHGYREAQVDGLGDFAACKVCHYDTRSGGHEDWQILVDDPLRFTEVYDGDDLTTDEEEYYAYTANLMNDVHMSHAMEFPYPQRMSNCVTCHEGKMDDLFADENFTAETCRSCHAVTGDEDYGTAEHSLQTIWENAGVESLHSADADCTGCHVEGGAAGDVLMGDLHSGGYDPMIYSADGTRYSDAIIVSIDDASFNSSTYQLTVNVSISEDIDVAEVDATDVEPDIRAAMYAYDAKDFYEYESGDAVDNGGGSWSATIDLSDYADDISNDMLRRIEIVVRPSVSLVVGDVDEDDDSDCGEGAGEGCDDHDYYCDAGECILEDDIGLAPTAPSRTFDLASNDFADGFYEDIVDVEKCNSCHDTLATTFHSPNRSGNIAVCRMCHNPTHGASHLEMQSRSLDSYIHSIHSFQDYDVGDIDFTDPVEAVRYEMHIEHRFPNFTIKNCEGCHNEDMYEVPDQTLTMPGVLSASDDVADRDITGVDSVVVGPGARACGACHRTHFINEDDFNGLVSFNQHTALNGYSVAEDDDVWMDVTNTVMAYFGEDTEMVADVGPETCATCHAGQGAEHQIVYDDYIDPE